MVFLCGWPTFQVAAERQAIRKHRTRLAGDQQRIVPKIPVMHNVVIVPSPVAVVPAGRRAPSLPKRPLRFQLAVDRRGTGIFLAAVLRASGSKFRP